LEQVHCTADRNLTQESIHAIADCGFVKRAENILITGAAGCGKSFLACAIGRQACAFGYKTLYFSMSKFLEKITIAKLEGTLLKLLTQIEKTHLLILDDFGLQPLDQTARLTILQILEDRYARKSTIITSQLPVSSWYEYINESTIADAIMDRLSASAHRYELKGPSMRKRNIK
jgi:DNA replication protein DnaC